MRPTRVRIAPLVLLAVALSGCAVAPPIEVPEPPPVAPVLSVGQRLFDIAALQLGAPYRVGGAGPEGFDCSGLVLYAHAGVGIRVPRTAALQRESAQPVPVDALRAGDLLFFSTDGGAVDHVGIYDGAGQFLHAPGRGRGIERARLDGSWYRSRFVAAGRFWSDTPRPASGASEAAR